MVEPTHERERRDRVVEAARTTRADAQRAREETVRRRQQSRRLEELLAQPDGSGATGQSAFAELPVPAALINAAGVVNRTNEAWRGLAVVGEAIGVGTRFGPAWTALTGDAFVEESVAAVATTGTRTQVETTVRAKEKRRFLVEIGPAVLRAGPGALVVLVDVTTQYEREQRLLFEATHDPLTAVSNRASLQRALSESLERLRRYHERFAVVYLDLDAFKALNDRYGHSVGDTVLRAVADRWRPLVRAPDLLARVGGDEFVVLVQHVSAGRAVTALATRLRDALAEPFCVGVTTLTVTVTAGIAFPPLEANADDAIGLADQAMYEQKRRHQHA